MDETTLPGYFGEWLKYRRRELDLTQKELAMRAGCSLPALRKIESGDRRPSKQLAGSLASSLEISPEEKITFIKVARGELNVEWLFSSVRELSGAEKPITEPVPTQGNLPGLLTPFIGRESELAALGQLLRDPRCRLLTLTGSGGIGKTRLAIQVADLHGYLFPDGIWFVPLAPLISSEFLVPAIADALDFKCHGLTNPRSHLLNHLSDKKLLLILDNAEHLLDGVGLLMEILENSPQVKLLVTSQERVNLRSEWVFEIEGLPVPPDDGVERFEEHSSVALFLQSAERTQANFKLSSDERPWVARICRMMGGMPLGIELAAAWVRLLSCKEIAIEIERNLDFLTVSMHDMPERHRSLRATLDHSWSLLDPNEKMILSRLSVFRGSFNREAAEEICGASLGILSSLKGKSLLRRTDRMRHDLHEIIQQYAALRLAEDASEEERLKDQHAVYFARLLSEWERALKSSMQLKTMSQMAYEVDNLRQAWQRMVTCCELFFDKNTLFSPEAFHSSLFSLSLFYEMRCRNREAISLFGDAAECLLATWDAYEEGEEKQRFETILGHITAYLGLHYAYVMQYQRARELLEQAIGMLGKNQVGLEKAQAQIMLAWVLQIQGQIQKSIDLLDETLTIIKKDGDMWWYVLALTHLASAYLSVGKVRESKALYQEGYRLSEPGDLRLRVPAQNGLARVNYMQKDYARAERLLGENLELCFLLGSKRQTAMCYMDLGQVKLATDRLEKAEVDFQECVSLLSGFGESHYLAVGLVYSGKCHLSQMETEAARRKFLQVIKIGRGLDIFHLVYWGLVNLARVYMLEGQLEQALRMALVLQRYSVEINEIQEDSHSLMRNLQVWLAPQQVEAARAQAEGDSIETLLDLIE